jgi:micrococcal nuclease
MKTLPQFALAALVLVSALGAVTGCSRSTDPATAAFVASAVCEPFHRPDCKWAQKISPGNLQGFTTRDKAIKVGHRPCKVGKP